MVLEVTFLCDNLAVVHNLRSQARVLAREHGLRYTSKHDFIHTNLLTAQLQTPVLHKAAQ